VDPIHTSHQPRARSGLTRGWPFLPAGAVLLVLFLLPMAVMVAFSLWRTNSDLDIVPDWTLDNYIYFFSEGTYVRTFLKTLIMAAAVTAAGIAAALPFAYFLVRYVGRRWQRLLLLAVIVPFWTSYLLRAYAWQAILGEKGALNQLLMGIGLIDEPSRLFVYNDLGVWLVLVYVYFPFAALALYSALEKFDFNQLNAAQDLGARPDQALRKILLPQIRPGLITACIFVFVPILGEFLTPTLVGGAQGSLIANLIINFFRGLQYTTMAAFSFVIAGFVIVVLVIFRRYLRVEDVVARG
jgi:spermidine/putrescine transport system permease protein